MGDSDAIERADELREERELIGMNIKLRRTRAKLTQEQLHLETGLSRAFLSRVERGDVRLSVVPLIRIARALACKPADLLDGVE
jgi:transcriptional regulator with XRE-family HTH domain